VLLPEKELRVIQPESGTTVIVRKEREKRWGGGGGKKEEWLPPQGTAAGHFFFFFAVGNIHAAHGGVEFLASTDNSKTRTGWKAYPTGVESLS